MDPSRRAEGRIRWWPVWAAISLPLVDILVQAISVNFALPLFMLEPVALIAWAVAGAVAIGIAVRSALRRSWPQTALTLTLPVFVIIVSSNLETSAHLCNDAADMIHFAVARGAYTKRIEAMPDAGRRVAIFELGGMVFASRGLVYDETDQVIEAPQRQAPDWKARVAKTELSCGYTARPMPGPAWWSGHWYLASFAC